MTIPEITAGLTKIIEELTTDDDGVPDGWRPHDWAYVRGIAAGEVLRLRDRLQAVKRLEEN